MEKLKGYINSTAAHEPRCQLVRQHVYIRPHHLRSEYNVVHMGIPGNQPAQLIQAALFCIMLLRVDRHLEREDYGGFLRVELNENP